MSGRFDLLEKTEGVVYGACAGMWVMILFAEPTLQDMKAARPALQVMSRRHPGGFPTLTWVLPQAGYRMANDARHTAAEITKEYVKSIVAQATLIEGGGFQAATVRAIVAGLDFMAATRADKKVFSHLTAAVAWCQPHVRPRSEGGITPQIVASLLELQSSVSAPA